MFSFFDECCSPIFLGGGLPSKFSCYELYHSSYAQIVCFSSQISVILAEAISNVVNVIMQNSYFRVKLTLNF